ncbi:MAG: ribonuclease III [Planctomycetota bacterium]
MEQPAAAGLEERLGYRFKDRGLLERALTHSSAKSPERRSNERLEFLGDAVLGLVVAHFLFSAFPDEDEGRLTRLRSAIVSTRALADFALALGLPPELRLGRGLDRERLSASVLADAVEALLGAAYLDGELEAVRGPILWGLADAIEAALLDSENFKSRLQELTQQEHKRPPTYVVLDERGPDHHKEFLVAAVLDERELGRGQGPSKKLAEQAAARAALELLRAGVEE